MIPRQTVSAPYPMLDETDDTRPMRRSWIDEELERETRPTRKIELGPIRDAVAQK